MNRAVRGSLTVPRQPDYVAVHQSVPAKSVKELVALAKSKPKTVHVGSSGSGGMPRLEGEMFKAATGARAE